MIYGIGTDIVALERIEKLHKKYGQAFAQRLLSRIELLEYPQSGRPVNFLAKRFAAKEAFAKAVGTGLRTPVSLRNIGVGHDGLGKPEFICEPDLQQWLQEKGIKRVHLSMSDEGGQVLAFAVAEK
ncbi:holo-ACP synthase [Neisseria dentiae]|uniref:holo-ACP synthase n=1 Tax=Neisseria dentiae TaxID=194197 RepID=UPI0035A09061